MRHLGNFLETVGQFFLMFYLLLGTLGANFLTFGPNLFTKREFFAKLWAKQYLTVLLGAIGGATTRVTVDHPVALSDAAHTTGSREKKNFLKINV